MQSSLQKTQSRQLSRLLITGRIHERTPLCVLIEIADAHGIKCSSDQNTPNLAHHLIETIHQTGVPTIEEIKNITNMTDWQCVARFVGKQSQWRQAELTQAYEFLIGFTNSDDPLNKIPENFVAGIQTPTNPYAINACVLYKTCVYHRLNVSSRTTVNQMAFSIRMLRADIESVARRAKIFVERDARRLDLINILMLSNHEIQDPDPPSPLELLDPLTGPKVDATHDMLTVLHNSLTDISELQHKITPSTPCGSIALAAIIYGIDISNASNPIREYNILKLAGRDHYQPGDPWLQYWYKRNPLLFDLNASFNPIFPVQYYNQNRLPAMVQAEGYSNDDITTSSPYELMQLNYVTETFYMGEMPNMRSMDLPIDLEPISTVPYGQLVCYGQRESKLQPVSMTELTELFNANQNFTNPFQQNSVFSTNAINKLKFIAQSPNGAIPTQRLSSETIAVRNRLVDAITGIEFACKANDEPTRQFGFTYRNASSDTKTAIIGALTNLLHAGMYMRGWMGLGHEYAVVKAAVPIEKEGEVHMNTVKSIDIFEKSCRSLGKIGVQLASLPLVYYKDGQYQVSNDASNGFTIGERVNIVKQGDETSNIASCIRLSSNWLCASAHKYLMSLGQPAPFDIFNLRYIS